jgi:hypothetical protein
LVADITQNAAESGADTAELEICEVFGDKAEFRFIARDNGKGMSGGELDKALDPFVTDGIKHPGRRVGLGIPFLIQTALQSGGGWNISSVKDGEMASRGMETGRAAKTGTAVEAWFDLGNVDTPPVGDIPGLFRTVLLFTGPQEIILRRSRQNGTTDPELEYIVKKSEMAEVLGDLEEVSSLALLGKYLGSLEKEE